MEEQMTLPAIDGDSRPYWEAAARGELLIQRCDQCRRHIFYQGGAKYPLLPARGMKAPSPTGNTSLTRSLCSGILLA